MRLTAEREAEIEQAKEIPGFPEYLATSHGRIISLKAKGRGRKVSISELLGCPDRKNYQRVRATNEQGQSMNVYVHTLVALAFRGPRPSLKHLVRHLDGNNRNNSATNLCWGTSKENEADKRAHGRAAIGCKHHSSKFNEAQIADIRKRYFRASYMQSNCSALAKEFMVAKSTIQKIVSGKNYAR